MWHDWTIWVSVFSLGIIGLYVVASDRATVRRQSLHQRLTPIRQIPRRIK